MNHATNGVARGSHVLLLVMIFSLGVWKSLLMVSLLFLIFRLL